MLVSQFILASAVLLAWEGAAASGLLDPFFFSQPSAIVVRVAHWIGTGALWAHLSTTFIEAILSFVIGGFVGVLVGFVLAGVPILAALLEPYIRMAKRCPRFWRRSSCYGSASASGRRWRGVTVVFFVVFFNTYRGVRSGRVDRQQRADARRVELNWCAMCSSVR